MSPSTTAHFLVVDDHPVLRQGVAAVLRSGFEGADTSESANLDEALKLARGKKISAVIVDPHMGSAADATSSISQLRKSINAPIVVFAADGNMRLLAEALKSAGYATACIGKWHLGDQPEFMPRRHGFDYYFGLRRQLEAARERRDREPTPAP